ncbi:alcohol dehydrogenase catalytic domain-containing protein [Alkalibaculum sp. M08DMB]|uniref:Alcohol dehydrogenase catalytic domain-containing protein n=1 Tax=Alkalibaculum sporogenes TaxID=2655001 RepID=A0A6A7K7P3_9FIRM|nr:galactitol-1-phosphate 5-dehydrogenase [Alkalibaculum sporogenes]MPW25371.1 alcohol dehydrogenase catalytic domain-containing protein [Alkalibaculum sporogenes]
MNDKKMLASILYGPGDIRCEETCIPEIGSTDVLIKVAYAAICGSDLPRSQNENGARRYPLILGHEFSGNIAEIGKDVTKVKIGDKVAVAPLIPDPKSEYSKAGEYGLSDNYNIIGTGSNGAFAQYVKVPEEHVVLVPDSLDLETAAGIEAAAIAFHGLRRSEIEVGDTVAVLGCGSIGQLTIQCAKIFGASKIIAVDIFDDKLKLAKELGADVTINSKSENLMEKILEETELGVHVVLETAGSSITQEQALMITRKHGKIVYIGISHNELSLSEKTVERILRAELTIKGSWNSYTAPYPGRDWEATMNFMKTGHIVFKPMISHRIQLSEIGQYLKDMYNHNIEFNKVIVEVNRQK